MALTKMSQAELADTLAETAGLSKAEARRILMELENIVAANLKECVRTQVAGVLIEPKLRKASKARDGRNPQTGETVRISAKPASVRVAARPLSRIKQHAPSVKKLQANL